jgi:polyhydroxyalkanoate synthase subunit PhaC
MWQRRAPVPTHRRCIEPLPGDYRFRAEGWQKQPYFWAQAFLVSQQWWHKVTHAVPGITPHHEAVVSFTARQLLDMFSISHSQLQEAL